MVRMKKSNYNIGLRSPIKNQRGRMKTYNDYEITDYLESEMEKGYDATIKRWVKIDDLIEMLKRWK